MLLPSALPCDPRPSLRRFGEYTGCSLTSPSRPSSHLATGLQSTCRALHSLLGVQPPPSNLNPKRNSSSNSRNAIISAPNYSLCSSKRLVKKRPPLSLKRGCKRRRELYESENDENNNVDNMNNNNNNSGGDYDLKNVDMFDREAEPSTPKRMRRTPPPNLPFGLERCDFYNLETPSVTAVSLSPSTPDRNETQKEDDNTPTPTDNGERTPRQQHRLASLLNKVDNVYGNPIKTDILETQLGEEQDEGEDWSDEDDRLLVNMVLDKLRLSRKEWNECARMLGTDKKSLGRRWKFLVDEGQVGLRFRRGMAGRRREDVRTMQWTG